MSGAGNLFLVGPMGAGKTTIGKRLANALQLEFVDSDREIERRTGASIPLIFELEGETGFRKREKEMLDGLSLREGIVVATGGGAILDPETRERLSQRGTVIYLRTSVEQQLERTARDQNRPLLQTPDRQARLESLFNERDPLYREVAKIVVDTDRRSLQAVVREILGRLGVRSPKKRRRRNRRGPKPHKPTGRP